MVGIREELQSGLRARLEEASATKDASLMLDLQTTTLAEQLTRLLDSVDPDDLPTCHLLGWFHWYRFRALPAGQGEQDLMAAITMFTSCFATGTGNVPEQLVPVLVEEVAPAADAVLQDALSSNDLDQISAAVQVWQRILAAIPDHPNRAGILSNIGLALRARFERAGQLDDADAAIKAGRDAVAATPADHPDRAGHLSNLGLALQARFERTGQLGDLDDAIKAGQEAVAAAPAGHPRRAGCLSNLGVVLRIRFERTGQLSDLDAAVQAELDAVAADPADPLDLAAILSNLANALRIRFERTGQLSDLDAAIQAGQDAVAATPADHSDWAGRQSNQGVALRIRFERTGQLSDLDAAVQAGLDAVAATPVDHPSRMAILSGLGLALQARFERTGQLGDLNDAIKAGQEAVAAAPADHPNRPRELSNLANALRIRFERTGQLGDLDAVIKAGQDAVAAAPADHPDRARLLFNLANALEDRFERTGEAAERDAAIDFFAQAAGLDLAEPSLRIRAAWLGAQLAASPRPDQAATLLEAGVRLLPETAPRELERLEQEHAVGGFVGLAADAAALALRDTQTESDERQRATRALRLLEAGRAVLLSQALDTRDDLTDLRRDHPDLAHQFTDLRDRLDQPADLASAYREVGDADNITTALVQLTATTQHRRRLADQLRMVLAKIRELPGFTTFGLPPETGELLSQAAGGPIVSFVISRYGSYALLLTSTEIAALQLPALTFDAVIDQVNAFHHALDEATDSRADPAKAQATLGDILAWLWDTAAGPVLDALRITQAPDGPVWPRVWWAPGGLLGLLPLHAAGHHADPRDDRTRRTVLDRVVSSYTPTIRALRYARRHFQTYPGQDADRVAAKTAPDRALIVAMPTTPGEPGAPLPGVRAETACLVQELPESIVLTEPEPEPDPGQPAPNPARIPTRANVLAWLPHCGIAHFACHGHSHPTDPSRSELLLHDHQLHPFTVAGLAAVNLASAQLAYLSACQTTLTRDHRLLDEAIHLTTAFQLAGYPHVIGTLWTINDTIAADVARDFYIHLRDPGGGLDTSRSALALHHAVRTKRDRYSRAPSVWAAHIHAGA